MAANTMVRELGKWSLCVPIGGKPTGRIALAGVPAAPDVNTVAKEYTESCSRIPRFNLRHGQYTHAVALLIDRFARKNLADGAGNFLWHA